MRNSFNPQYYGIIHHYTYKVPPKNKKMSEEIVSENILTDFDGAHIFDGLMQHEKNIIKSTDISKVSLDNCCVTITTSNGTINCFCDSPKKAKSLHISLTAPPVSLFRIKCDRCTTIAYHSLESRDNSILQNYRSKIEENIKILLKIFDISDTYVQQISTVFACLMRLRFKTISPNDFNKQIGILFTDFNVALTRVWLEALLRISSHDLNDDYYSIHASNIAKTLSRFSILSNTEIEKINSAAQSLSGPTIMKAIESPLFQIKQKEHESYQKFPPLNHSIYEKTLEYVIVVVTCSALNIYIEDLFELTMSLSSLMEIIKDTSTLSSTMIEIQQIAMNCAKESLRLWDGKRFNPDFHIIYCIWGLKFLNLDKETFDSLIPKGIS